MKTKLKRFQARMIYAVVLGIGSSYSLAAPATDSADPANTSILWSQIGAKARADYRSDGLAVIPTAEGARLSCVFQRLEAEATREGLWLTSTLTNEVNDRFRVTATEVGRVTPCAPGAANIQHSTFNTQLETVGNISLASQTVRFSRPGLTEEYTVSMDGVRQDFIIEHPPLNSQLLTLNQRAGELAVRLAVNGARVVPSAAGAQLVLESSERKIAYSRLRVTDATGKELSARMEVASGILPDVEGAHPAARDLVADFSTASLQHMAESAGLEAAALRQTRMSAATTFVVLVNDADAVYPVRIDPTFSDANWSALDSGIGGLSESHVSVLAVLGSDLYAGGYFTNAGNSAANHIAKWNGSSWSVLGSGMNSYVEALAVSGSDLYAGGAFTTAGGSNVNYIARWNGNSWSALGSGMNSYVGALEVSGGDVYAGGSFMRATNSGGVAVTVNRIAKWNGNSWSALGSGMNEAVVTLAVSGSNLYAGGFFTTAGGSAATNVAKWDGSSWSSLASGINNTVLALAVPGGNVYAAGQFTTAGGSPANHIARWDGSNWSALGSGMDGSVSALAVSGSDLYAGGGFTMAGGKVSASMARAYLPTLPTLSALRSGTDVMISWPSPDTAGFLLEQTGTLSPPLNWVTNSASVTDDGTSRSVSLPATNSAQFFRLRRP